ncbi:MAG: Hsp20/alpha crystallin family protein [Anaerolineales bacterium]|nr:Hsp20/alpha crystallin family protein [Anaerolineales bacterium]MDW8228046.1 Hsp20/alpha crystallin family protein [Anaerolineales bacterium]
MTYYLAAYPIRLAQRPMPVMQCDSIHPDRYVLPVNVLEVEDGYRLHVLVPGLKAEDIRIDVLENVVNIEANFKSQNQDYLIQELPQGSFRRTLRFPVLLEAAKVDARLSDGMLTVHLPKADSLRPKTIKVTGK